MNGFLNIFLIVLSFYVWWCLYNGRVHLPARFPGRDLTIERWRSPITFWIVWTVYLAIWCYLILKTFPFFS